MNRKYIFYNRTSILQSSFYLILNSRFLKTCYNLDPLFSVFYLLFFFKTKSKVIIPTK